MPVEQGYGGGSGWSAEQRRNAALIVKIGQQMGLSRRDILIGLITAAQESSLRNLKYGDRDSQGLFQQRPSQGWGTVAQVTDPVYATKKFFTELQKVEGRKKMRLTEAAQAVQRSAYPDAYAKHVGPMRDMLRRYSKPGLITPSEARGGRVPLGPGPGPATTETFGSLATPQLEPAGLEDPAGQAPGVPASSALAATTDATMGAPGLAAPQAGVPAALTSLPKFETPDEYKAMFGETNVPYQKGVDGWRRGVVEYAQQFIGTPYVWGGTDLNSGVDCSGFIQSVFKQFGINLPRVSYQQANYGTKVSLSKLKPGDLIAMDNSSRNNGADHVAIWLGGGKIIEAAKPGTNVRIRRLGKGEGAYGVRIDK